MSFSRMTHVGGSYFWSGTSQAVGAVAVSPDMDLPISFSCLRWRDKLQAASSLLHLKGGGGRVYADLRIKKEGEDVVSRNL